MDQRKTFYINNDTTKPIRAGGVIVYRKNKNHTADLLLIFSRGIYEDIGGRTDTTDTDIYDTVAREVEEETNNIISRESIKDRLNSSKYVYCVRSKYIIFLVEATEKEACLESSIFGKIEIHDNISRLIKWVPVDTILDATVIKYKLNYRMKNPHLFNKLKDIRDDAITSIRMI